MRYSNRRASCRCGCGNVFKPYGRQEYMSRSHRQRDYRNRKQAKTLAWKYVAEVCAGDMAYFAEVYEAYYDQIRNGQTLAVVA